MRNILKLALAGLLLLPMSQTARADTLVLKDGTSMSGSLVAATTQTVTFKDVKGVVHRYQRTQIQSLKFETISGTTTAPTAQSKTVETTLPVGTEIAVRTNEVIDSKTAKKDQAFAAQVDQEVIDASNRVVIPKGSPTELVIRSTSSGGVTGSPEMMLDIQSITVGGTRYLVSTAEVSQKKETGIGMNVRTAEAIGGGAALGTIVGAVAGQGKGAAIGAAVGAAAGAGTQILIKGKEVRVPAETILKFKLDEPISLQAAS